jgi:lipoprotein-anchoring transpeptidase ErfK/SrfK
VIVLVFLFSGMAYAAYRYEQSNAGRILPGVTIANVRVGGLSRDRAIKAVSAAVEPTLAREITMTAAGKHWTATLAEMGLRADVAGTVDRAFGLTRSYSWMDRAYRRLANKPISRSFSVPLRLSPGRIRAFVSRVAKEVGKPAQDAQLTLSGGKLVMIHAHPGRALRRGASIHVLRQSVLALNDSAQLPMKEVSPRIPNDELGKTIVVNVSKNMLYLYDGFRIMRSYPVATAKQGFLTPDGAWQVVAKVENPTWHNPDPTGWGAGEPLVIPPGPDNPLGTRALYLNAPGIRIHGTPSDSSIGTYASHGCIRMHIPDSEALYPLVPVETPVFIVGSPPWGETKNPGAAG